MCQTFKYVLYKCFYTNSIWYIIDLKKQRHSLYKSYSRVVKKHLQQKTRLREECLQFVQRLDRNNCRVSLWIRERGKLSVGQYYGDCMLHSNERIGTFARKYKHCHKFPRGDVSIWRLMKKGSKAFVRQVWYFESWHATGMSARFRNPDQMFTKNVVYLG